MELNGIKPADGAKHAKRRVGRGIGSGLGTLSHVCNHNLPNKQLFIVEYLINSEGLAIVINDSFINRVTISFVECKKRICTQLTNMMIEYQITFGNFMMYRVKI